MRRNTLSLLRPTRYVTAKWRIASANPPYELRVTSCKDLKKILKKEELSNELFQLLSPHQHINAFNNNSLKLLGTKAGLKPLSMLDLLGIFNTSFDINQSKFWIKTFIYYSMCGTELFFSPLIEGPAK